jgi:hypothetical protein
MSELNLDQTTITELQAIGRKHIQTAESNPDCTDLFDYWDCYTLENGDLIDYNISEANEKQPYDWSMCAYGLDEPTEDRQHYSINTDQSLSIPL